jgi:excisionase family DNA binding protein
MAQVKLKKTDKYTLLNPKDASVYLGIHIITVYRLCKQGKLPFVRLSSRKYSHIRVIKELIGE